MEGKGDGGDKGEAGGERESLGTWCRHISCSCLEQHSGEGVVFPQPSHPHPLILMFRHVRNPLKLRRIIQA